MKKAFIISVLLMVTTIISAQTKAERKQLKEIKAQKEYLETKTLINSRIFAFEGEWVTPSGGGSINLIGNTNYLKVSKDSVNAYLPYFGVVHSGIGYGGGGLKFNAPMKNYKVEFNDKKKRIRIKFESKNSSERFDVVLSVFYGGNASLSITGSHRSNISYQGKVSSVKEEDEK